MTRASRHSRWQRTLLVVLIAVLPAAITRSASAYPEFQKAYQKSSGRVISCAMCHEHPEGPNGIKHGQIGSLNPAELKALNRARSALDPGSRVDSPILNDFGDSLLDQLGKRRIVQLRSQPLQLASLINPGSDLDRDGIPDARELSEGTDPLDPRHGNPFLLFINNARRHLFHLLMLAAATLLGILGLSRLLRWFAWEARQSEIRKP